MTENEPEEAFGSEVVREMLRSRLKTAARRYEAGINRLWAGCGGGVITVVTGLRHPGDWLFWFSILSFGLGILSLAVGAFLTLISARSAIRHLEEIDGILEMRANLAKRPSYEEGLGVWHPQTLTALTAAALFCIGLISTGALIACIGDSP